MGKIFFSIRNKVKEFCFGGELIPGSVVGKLAV